MEATETVLETQTANDPEVDRIYAGAKAKFLPIHEKLMARIAEFGPFEIAPKKTYLSLRRKKQFATIGPPTNTRMEIGLNNRTLTPTDRLAQLPPGDICTHKVKLTDISEADDELVEWIRLAYESAG